jgi:hypothetical protein
VLTSSSLAHVSCDKAPTGCERPYVRVFAFTFRHWVTWGSLNAGIDSWFTHTARRWSAMWLAVLCVACAQANTPVTVQHPTDQNLVPPASLAAILTDEPGARQQADALGQVGAADVIVGHDDETGAVVFGNIADVVISSAGTVLALDSRVNVVREFSTRGDLVATFGGAGLPAGRLEYPQRLAVAGSGQLFVADRNKQIKVFNRGSREWTFSHAFALTVVPEDMCFLKGELFVRGWAAGRTIHVYSQDGAWRRSFGREYADQVEMVRDQLSDGRLACVDSANLIIDTIELLPYLFGYTPTGELRWISRIASFAPLDVTSGTEGGQPFVQQNRSKPFDWWMKLLGTDQGRMIAQLRRTERASALPAETSSFIRVYEIEAQTGRGRYVGRRPTEILAVQRGYAVAAEHSPRVRMLIRHVSDQK